VLLVLNFACGYTSQRRGYECAVTPVSRWNNRPERGLANGADRDFFRCRRLGNLQDVGIAQPCRTSADRVCEEGFDVFFLSRKPRCRRHVSYGLISYVIFPDLGIVLGKKLKHSANVDTTAGGLFAGQESDRYKNEFFVNASR
jgi:hypothetical protein